MKFKCNSCLKEVDEGKVNEILGLCQECQNKMDKSLGAYKK